MARISKHEIVGEWLRPDNGRTVITSTGKILRKSCGGRWSERAYCKRGLTLAELDRTLCAAGLVRVRLSADPDFVPNPVAKAEKRERDAAKRAAKNRDAEARQTAEESALETDAQRVDYVVACLRARSEPRDERLRYVYQMARFHGGATGGYLGTAIGADFLVSDLGRDEVAKLDALADTCARRAFGSDMRAAAAWARVL